jgi:hypothetical protein
MLPCRRATRAGAFNVRMNGKRAPIAPACPFPGFGTSGSQVVKGIAARTNAEGANVAFWHEADLSRCLLQVRYQVKSGRILG